MDDAGLGRRERLDATILPASDRQEPPVPELTRADIPHVSPEGAVTRKEAATTPPKRRRLVVVVLLALALVGIGGTWWWLTRNLQSTDDAFIDGNIVPLSARISGTVETVLITDNQQVAEGDLLIQLDPRDQQAALDNATAVLASAVAQRVQAEASLQLLQRTTEATLQETASALAAARSALAEARAEVTVSEAEMSRAKNDAARYEQLVGEGYASRQRYEQAIAAARAGEAHWLATQQAVHMAEARIAESQGRHAQAETAPQQIAVQHALVGAAVANVEQARAALEQARLDLSYTRVYAPHAGHVTRKAVQSGDVIQNNQVLAWVVFGTPWVTANFKETQLAAMRPGQAVSIRIDAYPGVEFPGRVDSLQRGTGARFSLLPPENATGNFVKVVQRVPVKILFAPEPDPAYVLGPGMSVVPTVRVGDDAAPQSTVAATGQ